MFLLQWHHGRVCLFIKLFINCSYCCFGNTFQAYYNGTLFVDRLLLGSSPVLRICMLLLVTNTSLTRMKICKEYSIYLMYGLARVKIDVTEKL